MQATRVLTEIAKEGDIRMSFLPINPRLPGPLRLLQRIKYVRTASTFVRYFTSLVAQTARADILHVFTASYYSYMLWSIPAIMVGRLFGKKVILNYRDGQCEDHLRNWKSALPTIRLVHEVVTPSGFLVDVFRKFGIEARTIFNVIDTSPFLYRRRSQLRPILMTNRSLEPLYNVPCILRAFAIVQTRYPEATLIIAHDGVCRPELEKLAAELGLRNTQFIGSVPHDRIAALYDSADIYLTTPNIDCMPGSLLECFASGLPIVATKAGGIPYMAKDGVNALLVNLDDHAALAENVFRLLEDPELVERLTDNGREEVKRYNGDCVRLQWAGLYRELAGAH